MKDDEKSEKIARLIAENDELTAEVERLRKRVREMQSQNYMAKQFVDEVHQQMMHMHVQSVQRVTEAEQRKLPGQFPGVSFETPKDDRWRVS